jgi:uncharacterized membrane protein
MADPSSQGKRFIPFYIWVYCGIISVFVDVDHIKEIFQSGPNVIFQLNHSREYHFFFFIIACCFILYSITFIYRLYGLFLKDKREQEIRLNNQKIIQEYYNEK